MVRNFPQVFEGDASVDARSTIVIRCILSMANECLQLRTLNPNLQITMDGSVHDMFYLNHDGKRLFQQRDGGSYLGLLEGPGNMVHELGRKSDSDPPAVLGL